MVFRLGLGLGLGSGLGVRAWRTSWCSITLARVGSGRAPSAGDARTAGAVAGPMSPPHLPIYRKGGAVAGREARGEAAGSGC